ncbi:MAG: hypothetical protein GYB68_11950 [Chloroflexi bacterium]|nr:hypothetical protein [Chloroflexota bacterium]
MDAIVIDPSGREPALPRRVESGSGLEPALAIDAAVRDLILALAELDGRERAAAIDLLTELGEDALPALLLAYRSEVRDMRLGALVATRLIADERMLPHTLSLLDDPDPWVRWSLGEYLKEVYREHSGALLEALRSAAYGERLARLLLHLTGAPLACDVLFLHNLLDHIHSDAHLWLALRLANDWVFEECYSPDEAEGLALRLIDFANRSAAFDVGIYNVLFRYGALSFAARQRFAARLHDRDLAERINRQLEQEMDL